MSINTNELVNRVAESVNEYLPTRMTKKQVRLVVDTFIDEVISAAVTEGKVHVSRLGRFVKVHKAERKGRNPRTGEELTITARDQVRYRPIKGLKKIQD